MTDYVNEAAEAISRLLFVTRSEAQKIAQSLDLEIRRAIHEATETARRAVRDLIDAPPTTEN